MKDKQIAIYHVLFAMFTKIYLSLFAMIYNVPFNVFRTVNLEIQSSHLHTMHNCEMMNASTKSHDIHIWGAT